MVIIGYDRDYCVLETIKDAVARGIKVVTSEHAMLTTNKCWSSTREQSLEYYRKNTLFLENLVDLYNYFYKFK